MKFYLKLALAHDFPRVKSRVKMDVIIHLNLPLKSVYLLKNRHQNPLRSFKDISIHMDGQTAESDFVLYYVVSQWKEYRSTLLLLIVCLEIQPGVKL